MVRFNNSKHTRFVVISNRRLIQALGQSQLISALSNHSNYTYSHSQISELLSIYSKSLDAVVKRLRTGSITETESKMLNGEWGLMEQPVEDTPEANRFTRLAEKRLQGIVHTLKLASNLTSTNIEISNTKKSLIPNRLTSLNINNWK